MVRKERRQVNILVRKVPIITVGISPCWDIFCRVADLDWGDHKQMNEQEIRPGGKALNISRALSWMHVKNTAAGLWGDEDYRQMQKKCRESHDRYIRRKFTLAPGRTRYNVNVVDTGKNREIHLRAQSGLVTRNSLRRLRVDLSKIVREGSICIFAGSFGDEKYLGEVQSLIQMCRTNGAQIAIDTSGLMLREIVDFGDLWLIKPNVAELSELLGKSIVDRTEQLVEAGTGLLDNVENVLISRGENGALLLTSEGVWEGCFKGKGRNFISSVGCGDYLLAGFLKGMTDGEESGLALETGLRAGTSRAWGLSEEVSWSKAKRTIKAVVRRLEY